jgi:hypothetical protein
MIGFGATGLGCGTTIFQFFFLMNRKRGGRLEK